MMITNDNDWHLRLLHHDHGLFYQYQKYDDYKIWWHDLMSKSYLLNIKVDNIDRIIIWYDTSWCIMISMIYDTSSWYHRWLAALCAQSWYWTTTTVSPTPTPCQSGSPSYFYRWLLSLWHCRYKVDGAQWRLIVVVTLIVIHWWGIPWLLNDTVGQSVAPPITTV